MYVRTVVVLWTTHFVCIRSSKASPALGHFMHSDHQVAERLIILFIVDVLEAMLLKELRMEVYSITVIILMPSHDYYSKQPICIS